MSGNHLRNYAETDGSIIVGAFDGARLVGASDRIADDWGA